MKKEKMIERKMIKEKKKKRKKKKKQKKQKKIETALPATSTTTTTTSTSATTSSTIFPNTPLYTSIPPPSSRYPFTSRISLFGEEDEDYYQTEEVEKDEKNELIKKKYSYTAHLIADRIGVYFNINGVSKRRTNVIVLNGKSYTMNELTTTLEIVNQSERDKEKTRKEELTIERIAASYAEETATFLKKNIKNLLKFLI